MDFAILEAMENLRMNFSEIDAVPFALKLQLFLNAVALPDGTKPLVLATEKSYNIKISFRASFASSYHPWTV